MCIGLMSKLTSRQQSPLLGSGHFCHSWPPHTFDSGQPELVSAFLVQPQPSSCAL